MSDDLFSNLHRKKKSKEKEKKKINPQDNDADKQKPSSATGDALKFLRSISKQSQKNKKAVSSGIKHSRKTPGKAIQQEKPAGKIYTVNEITLRLKRSIEQHFGDLTIKGEVSKPAPPAKSGHIYFTIKDNDAVLNCVIWKNTARQLKYLPIDGDEVIVSGGITVFAPSGRYQFGHMP